MELGPFEAHGCSWNTGNLENRWDNRELRNHQDPWGYRDAPGALGCLGTEGALGCSGMQWDGAGRAGSPGMRRCGLKAPPRGSRRELPGEARDTRESPGARAGPRRRDTERPSIPGNMGRQEFRDGTNLPGRRNHLGWDRAASRLICHGNTTSGDHSPHRATNHPGKTRSAAGMGGFWEGLMLMHGM